LHFGGFGWSAAGVALIDVSQCDAVAGRFLNGLGEAADFGTIIGVT
jgi:hypothetical protein